MADYTRETLPKFDHFCRGYLRPDCEDEAALLTLAQALPDGVYREIEFKELPEMRARQALSYAVRAGYVRRPDYVAVCSGTPSYFLGWNRRPTDGEPIAAQVNRLMAQEAVAA